MSQPATKRPLSTGQAQWKLQWIGVFLEAGIDRAIAENAFQVYYGNQEIDIFTDPIGEAKALCGAEVTKDDW